MGKVARGTHFKTFNVSSPVLVTVVTTLRLSTPSTVLGASTFKERPGAAMTLVAKERARATREAEGNMAKTDE